MPTFLTGDTEAGRRIAVVPHRLVREHVSPQDGPAPETGGVGQADSLECRPNHVMHEGVQAVVIGKTPSMSHSHNDCSYQMAPGSKPTE